MIPAKQIPTFNILQIENKSYRVPELDQKSTQSYFSNSDSWVANQQGISSKNKNFQKNRSNMKVFQEILTQHNRPQQQDINNSEQQEQVDKSESEQVYEVKQNPPSLQQVQVQHIEPMYKIKQDQEEDNQVSTSTSTYTHSVILPLQMLDLTDKLSQLQKDFINQESILKGYAVDLRKAHIKLLPLNLNNQKKIERAKAAFKNIGFLVLERLNDQGLSLSFEGIGVFGKGPRQARSLYVLTKQGSKVVHDIFSIIVKEYLKAKLISENDLQNYKYTSNNYELDLIYVTIFDNNQDDQFFDVSSVITKHRNIVVGRYQLQALDLIDNNDSQKSRSQMPLASVKLG